MQKYSFILNIARKDGKCIQKSVFIRGICGRLKNPCANIREIRVQTKIRVYPCEKISV